MSTNIYVAELCKSLDYFSVYAKEIYKDKILSDVLIKVKEELVGQHNRVLHLQQMMRSIRDTLEGCTDEQANSHSHL